MHFKSGSKRVGGYELQVGRQQGMLGNKGGGMDSGDVGSSFLRKFTFCDGITHWTVPVHNVDLQSYRELIHRSHTLSTVVKTYQSAVANTVRPPRNI